MRNRNFRWGFYKVLLSLARAILGKLLHRPAYLCPLSANAIDTIVVCRKLAKDSCHVANFCSGFTLPQPLCLYGDENFVRDNIDSLPTRASVQKYGRWTRRESLTRLLERSPSWVDGD